MSPQELRDSLLAALDFQSEGGNAGNVTVGAGHLDGRPVHVGLVLNRASSGAVGALEAERLGAMLCKAAAERVPVALFLDSAGAKVSEGLRALGAFRAVYRAGLDCAMAGAPIAVVLGRNCFGGGSMLAHLAARRLFAPDSQLAMSGPAVIATASGLDPLDEMFRAMAEATMSAGARAKACDANTLWQPGLDAAWWLRQALAAAPEPVAAFRDRHEALALRLGKPLAPRAGEPVRRKDLERLYAAGCEIRESEGLLEGHGRHEEGDESVVGLVGKAPLDALRAWRFSDAVWRHLPSPPERLRVVLDCAGHAARLEEEKLILTEYVVDMAFALAGLAACGTRVELTVVGEAGGGVYVALAAPAQRVSSLHGASIQVLPRMAVTAILGESREAAPSFDEYRKAGVAEQEIRLGIVP